MKTDAQMIAKYNAKYGSPSSQSARVAMADEAINHYATWVNDWAAVETNIRALLGIASIARPQYWAYFAFGHAGYKINQHFSAGAQVDAFDALIDKWVARGLDISMCETIRLQAYNTGAPIGP